MYKVAHIFGVMDYGGAELRTIEAMEALKGDGVLPTYITLSGRRGTLEDRIAAAGGVICPVKLGLTFPIRFLMVCKRERFDLVHSHVATFSGAVLLLARVAGVPKRIAHFRSDGDGHPNSLRRRLQRRLLSQLVAMNATAVVGVSPGVLETGYRPLFEGAIRGQTLPNGVDTRRARPTKVLAPWLVDVKQCTILVNVSRPKLEKNRSRLPGIVKEVNRERPCVLFLVGGRGEDAQALHRAIEESGTGHLVFEVGARDDAIDLMSEAHVFVTASTREGLPGVVLESLSVGTPVVCNDLPGTRFIAEHATGVTIAHVKDADTVWARQIIDVVEAAQCRNRIIRSVTMAFGKQAHVDRVRQLYLA